jgi:hypothetical protein
MTTHIVSGATAYPLAVGPTGRYLVDQSRNPFLLVGDTAWSIIASATKEEAVRYLDDRHHRGFNTVLVNLLEHYFSPDPPRNRYGDGPFTTPGNFRTPNPAYFDHARWVMERAAERGFLVLLAPCYLGAKNAGWPGTGFVNEGWFGEVVMNGHDGCRDYGRFVGERFGDLDGILWVMGGDRDPGDALLELGQMAQGIREADPRHLFTAHCGSESVPAEVYRGESWLDVNNTYTYGIVHAKLFRDYIRVPTMPFFLIESAYENEHSASEVQLRRQAYWSMLRGGFGHVFGCTPVWWFSDGWEEALDTPGSRGMTHFADAFGGRRWWDLVPEPPAGVKWDPRWQGERLVLSGLGESRGLDFCSVARTPDGRLAMAYMPTPRRMTLDLSLVAGDRARLSWFDPVGGGWIDGGVRPTAGSAEVDPPGNQDWLLAIEAIDRGAGPAPARGTLQVRSDD